ncbi:MAG: pitrilysin family protein [Syntrophaceticus sp.]
MYYNDVLDNGVTIVSEEVPGVHSVAVGFWVKTGSRHEEPEEAGISHLIEHLLFKGTAKRNAKQIAEAIEEVGGQLNAFTSKEYTCYYVRVLAEYLPLAVDVLSDMVFNSLFREEDIAREKKVVAEEISMYEDTPDDIIHDYFSQTIWDGHPLGRPIIGTMDSLSRINRERLLSFYNRHYSPSNMVVALAGKFQHSEAVDLLGSALASLPAHKVENQITPPQTKATIKSFYRDLEQVQICMGVPGVSLYDENVYHLQIVNNILGGGASSRLFQRVREERALVYAIYSYYLSFLDSGLFTIYAGTNPVNCQDVLDLSWQEIYDITESGVLEKELKRAKTQVKGSLLLAQESVLQRMHRLGKSELVYNRLITIEEILDKINALTEGDVQSFARKIFNPKQMTITVLGPLTEDKIRYPFAVSQT